VLGFADDYAPFDDRVHTITEARLPRDEALVRLSSEAAGRVDELANRRPPKTVATDKGDPSVLVGPNKKGSSEESVGQDSRNRCNLRQVASKERC
jgi:hypothetical protein